jgi:8-oxo-dGTP pyrophosphatase MutT (NUDIX family)
VIHGTRTIGLSQLCCKRDDLPRAEGAKIGQNNEMKYRKAMVVIVWAPQPQALNVDLAPAPDHKLGKKVLLLRLISSRGGYWQPVTGKVEENETFLEGALREAREETGLPFDRHPQYLGLEYSFEGRWGPATERAFLLPLFGGNEPPTPILDGKEHDAFEWLSPNEAMARVKWPNNQAAIARASSGPSPILLSKRGDFYQDGEEVTHARTRELLHRSIVRISSNSWALHVAGEELELVLEDTPRVVLSYDRWTGMMSLSGGTIEELAPGTLQVRHERNGLVCTLTNGWQASFTSPAYYEIAKDIQESTTGEYVLNFRGRNYGLAIAPKPERINR